MTQDQKRRIATTSSGHEDLSVDYDLKVTTTTILITTTTDIGFSGGKEKQGHHDLIVFISIDIQKLSQTNY